MAKKYWFTVDFSDGSSSTNTNEGHGYDTYEEAEEEAVEWISNYHVGNEICHMSNPWDWPLDEDEIEYSIIEDDEDTIENIYSSDMYAQ